MNAPTSSVLPIGIIGLGLMGGAFATRLLHGGCRVLGFDTDARCRDAFVTQGGTSVTSAAEVFQRCDRVILSLPSHREVGDVISAARDAMGAGQIIIDTTTGDPEHAETMARELALRGVVYLDATVSGNSAQVRAGTAVMMVGGDADAFAGSADILGHLAGEAFHTGGSGSGAKMKLVTNCVLGLNRAALAEGLALGEVMGLDPEMTLRVMRRSPAYSRIMDVKGEKMIRSEFSPDARLSQHLKDVRLMLETGERAGLPMTLTVAHRAVLEQAEADGLGALDNSALIQVLRGISSKEKSREGGAHRPVALASGREEHGPRTEPS